MKELKHLFENNRAWVERKKSIDPSLFERTSEEQSPKYLWIGCADSRIPANEILGLEAGELFVHRNIANLFPHTDFNCLSVLQYAVDHLSVEHVIVCGHYGCGGVAAALEKEQFGLVDNWLRNVRDVYARERQELDQLDAKEKYARLVELNVLHQVVNICHTSIVQNAWASGKKLVVHGWVYDLKTGLLKDLECCVASLKEVEEVYHTLKLH